MVRYLLGVVVVVVISALGAMALRKPDKSALDGRLEDIERNIANEEFYRDRAFDLLLQRINDLELKVERIESR